MVCDKIVCERWCVTKLCVKDCVGQSGVKDGVSKMACQGWCVTKVVCDKIVDDKMVCDKEVCERWRVKDGV